MVKKFVDIRNEDLGVREGMRWAALSLNFLVWKCNFTCFEQYIFKVFQSFLAENLGQENCWKLKICSFRIGCWIRWARKILWRKQVFEQQVTYLSFSIIFVGKSGTWNYSNKNLWKFKIRSFEIGCWIRWTRQILWRKYSFWATHYIGFSIMFGRKSGTWKWKCIIIIGQTYSWKLKIRSFEIGCYIKWARHTKKMKWHVT